MPRSASSGPRSSVIVTSPQVSLDEYLRSYSHESLSADDVISIMVGDLQRIRLYPRKASRSRRTSRTTSGARTSRWSPPGMTRI